MAGINTKDVHSGAVITYTPGDNPVYVSEAGNTANGNSGRRQPKVISPVHYVKPTPVQDNRQRTDSEFQERELKNPIYGEAEESREATYAEPFGNPQRRNQNKEEHEFDNPIYGDDDDDNDGTYTVPMM